MTSTRGKILVIRGGAIGDFILTLPVLAALRRQFPETHLEVLGYPHIVQLAEAGGLADRVQSIDARALAGFFARHGELAAELADYFAGFHVILSYLFDPDRIFQDNVASCSAARFIVGPHRPDERLRLHATETLLKPLERLAIFAADPVPRLSLNSPPSTLNQLALHPGSGSERKNWPESNWAGLLDALLRTTETGLLLVGGEAEGDRLQRLAAALPSDRAQVLMNAPLPELARRLSRCAGFIGHDSGITHLAAAVGTPALVLWGESAQDIWAPRGDHVTILRHPVGLNELPIEKVLHSFRAMRLPALT